MTKIPIYSDEGSNGEFWYELVEYTRALNKAYHFYKDGHFQDVKYHPWTNDQIISTFQVKFYHLQKRIGFTMS